MTRRDLLWLALLGVLVFGLVAAFEPLPGYMDAEYYFATGLQLARGQGFSEPFIWNYMADPGPPPVPSHTYWMPLPSLLAALGMTLAARTGYAVGRWIFLLLAAALPPLSAALAYALTGKRRLGWLAGMWAALPAFYAPFVPASDTFAPYMVLGGLFFLLMGPSRRGIEPSPTREGEVKLQRQRRRAFGLGLLAGLMYLTRADGLLWFLMALLALWRAEERPSAHEFIAALLGWALFSFPWMARNLLYFDTPFAPGGARALWLTSYNELFAYPASQLTCARWWASGLRAISKARLWALGQNLQTALAVQGEVFLLPLILIGGWSRRGDRRVRLGGVAWLLTIAVMTLAFPFAGARGGFFHAGAALQPLWWALAALGLEQVVSWGARRRGWNGGQAWRVFVAAGIVFALALTGFILNVRVSGSWGAGQRAYQQLEARLTALGAPDDALVMVNDPPGYYLASGRMAVVIPDGGVETLLAAARHYGARYAILEANHPQGLNDLYENPAQFSALKLLWQDESARIFEISEQ